MYLFIYLFNFDFILTFWLHRELGCSFKDTHYGAPLKPMPENSTEMTIFRKRYLKQTKNIYKLYNSEVI